MRCHEISAPSLFYSIKFYWQWPKNTKISPSPASQPSHGQVHEWMISNSGKKDNFPRIFWVKKVTDFNLRRHFKTKPLHCFQKEKCGFFGPNFFSPFPFTIYTRRSPRFARACSQNRFSTSFLNSAPFLPVIWHTISLLPKNIVRRARGRAVGVWCARSGIFLHLWIYFINIFNLF